MLDLNERLGRESAAAIGGSFVCTDTSDEAAVNAALEQAESANGTARVLVNCAGIALPAKVIDRNGEAMPLAEFSRIATVNLLGTSTSSPGSRHGSTRPTRSGKSAA